jgi:Calcineurin-like phosphoesterase
MSGGDSMRRSGIRLIPILAGLIAGAFAAGVRAEPAPAGGFTERAWVQVTDRGPEARVVTQAHDCPSVSVDGAPRPMQQRAPASADFPVTVCEARLPAMAHRVSIGGHALPLPRALNRIVIFGDTGCRLKGKSVQACDDPAEWPFAQVARLAAGHHPDLVIHVGDYYYRESPCPAGRAGCAGSPWGDNWTTWDADFFAPAAPLLAAAPWVVVRGNHEDCARGGPGWFALLDNGPAPLACPATAAPMTVDVGGLTLYVLDSSGTEDASAPPDAVAMFATQLDALKAHPPHGQAWIVTHRPIWGLAVAKVGPAVIDVPINATEQAAARGRDLSGVAMVVSGHIHHFASFEWEGNRPPQLIVGTGGDVGEAGDSPKFLDGEVGVDGMGARRFGFDRYGFLVLDRSGAGWSGTFYDTHDRPIAVCRQAGRKLACHAAGG